MDVRNCRNCGRLFNYIAGNNICPECKVISEKKFVEVRDYIREHNSATINQIAEDNNVSPNLIKQWIREERLQFSKDSPIGIECEKCGATIKTGKYCDNCKNTIASNLTEAFTPTRREVKQGHDGDRMFFSR